MAVFSTIRMFLFISLFLLVLQSHSFSTKTRFRKTFASRSSKSSVPPPRSPIASANFRSLIDRSNALFLGFSNNFDPGDKKDGSSASWVDTIRQWPLATLNSTETTTEAEEDFPGWLQSLNQWPMTKKADDDEVAKDDLPTNPFVSNFASLLNLEGILIQSRAAGEDLSAAPSGTSGKFGWDDFSAVQGLLGSFTEYLSNLSNETANTAASYIDFNDLVVQANPKTFLTMLKDTRIAVTFQNELVDAATDFAREKGLDVNEATESAKNTTDYFSRLLAVSDRVLRSGYVRSTENAAGISMPFQAEDTTTKDDEASGPLLQDYISARALTRAEYGPGIRKVAEMGWLCGGIYEQKLERTLGLGHAIVAEGRSADVFWMVTDSIASKNDFNEFDDSENTESVAVRTIVLRGYDASDDTVDREKLFITLCDMKPEVFHETRKDILVHSGLMSVARELYKDLKQYIEWSGPSHRLVFTGHSIGGALSVLLMLLLVQDKGADFVREKLLRVFTYGSPPTLRFEDSPKNQQFPLFKTQPIMQTNPYGCDILTSFGLPSSIVYGFVQPWDPVTRMFSTLDGLYPLVDDIGEDGVTLYANGPPRTLRPITRAMTEAWEGWPDYRDMLLDAGGQNYSHVGVQHIILPEPARYLQDRFVSGSVNLPPVDTIVRISSNELFDALEEYFPIDVFQLSTLSVTIRAFLHHFYPAYDSPLIAWADRVEKDMISAKERKGTASKDPFPEVKLPYF